MEKTYKIVTIPIIKHKEIGNIVKNDHGHYDIIENEKDINVMSKFKPQHLLILSDDEIKKDNYFLTKGYHPLKCEEQEEIQKCQKIKGNTIISYEEDADILGNCYFSFDKDKSIKIVAAYPKIGKLPLINKNFIISWIKNPINEIQLNLFDVLKKLKTNEQSIINAAIKYRNDPNFKLYKEIKIFPSMILRERKNGFIAGAKSNVAKNYWHEKFIKEYEE